jgi:hypothetical protein
MSRARELAKLANPEVFSVDSVNNVGLNSLTPDAKLDVVGVVSATSFSGDGSQLTGIIAGATLSPSNGTQRLVVTSQTTGSMTEVGTNSDITYDTGTNTISATNFTGSLLGNATGLQGTPSITVQDVTAETVSIAGTLSYEDVTNINSVGIITANKGIQVPDYGMTVTGVVTATSYVGDGSGLSGVESGVSNFVASGNIPNGSTVVINTDGTVGVVTATGSSTPSSGSASIFNNADTSYYSTTYDSANQKVVIAYRDQGNSNYGTAIVGTVSGTSISFGSEVVFQATSTTWISATYDSANQKVVIAYRDASIASGKVIVGTVSGTSISFGTASSLTTTDVEYVASVYDSANEKIVFAYSKDEVSNYAFSRVGTVSGNSISFGIEVTVNSANTDYISLTYDSTNSKVVCSYRDNTASQYGRSVVGTVSGTSISFGTAVQFNLGSTLYISSVYDSTNQKVVIFYRDQNNSNSTTAVVGTVSGTSISFGSDVIFTSNTVLGISATYDSTNEKIVVVYGDEGNSDYGTAITGTVSGNSIGFGSESVFNSALTETLTRCSTYDSTNDKVVVAYKDSGTAAYSVVITSTSESTNLTAENYIGLAAETIGSGATGKITTVGGINTGQTGLTTAQTYYVQNNGGIGTVTSNPSVVAGTSVSDTEVLVWKS